jgi:hypothetical protein
MLRLFVTLCFIAAAYALDGLESCKWKSAPPASGGHAYVVFAVGNGEARHDRRPTIAQAKLSLCSLKLLNVSSPIIAATALLTEQHGARLFKAGADAVCNFTWWDWPFHNWHPSSDEKTQHRKDGSLTYFRFLALNFTGLSRVIMADSDVWWFESPETMFENPLFPFISFGEGTGFNMHVSVIQPYKPRFEKLMLRASTSNYTARINTEQDVFESEFEITDGRGGVHFGAHGTYCARHEHYIKPPAESGNCTAYRLEGDKNDELQLDPDREFLLPVG